MSAITVERVWKEYGEQVVLEQKGQAVENAIAVALAAAAASSV